MERNTDLWEYLKQTEKNIVIYGMGDGCDKIMKICREKQIPIRGIFASDEHVREKTVHGFPLLTYAQAKARFGDLIVLLAFGVFRDDLMAKILQMNQEVELYAPEVPLFGGGLFDRHYVAKNCDSIRAVKAMLSDEQSHLVFQNLIRYKQTGLIAPLIECETKKEDDYRTLIPFQAGDVYADLGAYDGDTALEWAALHPDYGHIFAVEPGEKTYQKLLQNCRALDRFEAVQAAVWNQNTTLSFRGKSGRSAAVSPEGNAPVKGIRLSDHLKRADFIKFDVEGAEKEAIEGAGELIAKQKPALCISCYHRTEDLFSIPLQIKAICPDYRVYLRHWKYVPAWDTVYFFIAQ